jgi:hypothetical protein
LVRRRAGPATAARAARRGHLRLRLRNRNRTDHWP